MRQGGRGRGSGAHRGVAGCVRAAECHAHASSGCQRAGERLRQEGTAEWIGSQAPAPFCSTARALRVCPQCTYTRIVHCSAALERLQCCKCRFVAKSHYLHSSRFPCSPRCRLPRREKLCGNYECAPPMAVRK